MLFMWIHYDTFFKPNLISQFLILLNRKLKVCVVGSSKTFSFYKPLAKLLFIFILAAKACIKTRFYESFETFE